MKLKKIFFFLVLSFWILVSFAISNANSSSASTLYKIDLLVFTHISDQALSSENWPDMLMIPNLKNVQELSEDATSLYQLLPNNLFGLKQESYQLNKHSNYKIILKETWTQPINTQNTKWIHISGGQAYDKDGKIIMPTVVTNDDRSPAQPSATPVDTEHALPLENQQQNDVFRELNGKIGLSKLGYYFNVYTRLYLTEANNGNSFSTENFQAIPLRSFKLSENRRTPLNKLNYIDHPLFGVLLKITKWHPNIPDKTTPASSTDSSKNLQ